MKTAIVVLRDAESLKSHLSATSAVAVVAAAAAATAAADAVIWSKGAVHESNHRMIFRFL